MEHSQQKPKLQVTEARRRDKAHIQEKKGIPFQVKFTLKEVFMAAENLQKQLERQESP